MAASGGPFADGSDYYINAVLSYPVGSDGDTTNYKECRMTMRKYRRKKDANKDLDKVPVGKVKDIHVSKGHNGRYCLDTHHWREAYRLGFTLLIIAGGLFVFLVGFVVALKPHLGKEVNAQPQRITLPPSGAARETEFGPIRNTATPPLPLPSEPTTTGKDRVRWFGRF